ncbi:PREDICTED: melanoma-associated antigen 12-like [Dipodomys ordii]|uniref:Melanoma-associated antigen 12-like n=1 Tax=Dipodomys ordii TaxID=10020 RepID=A0A1S3FZX5_DIPOR|nr:PREDICTED: melanoma-associated antigen 12-like [Dipodomys ordii]
MPYKRNKQHRKPEEGSPTQEEALGSQPGLIPRAEEATTSASSSATTSTALIHTTSREEPASVEENVPVDPQGASAPPVALVPTSLSQIDQGSSQGQQDQGSFQGEEDPGSGQGQQDQGSSQVEQDHSSGQAEQNPVSCHREQDQGSCPQEQDQGSGQVEQSPVSCQREQDQGSRPREQDQGSRPREQDQGSRPQEQDQGSRPREQDQGSRPREQDQDQGSRPREQDQGSRPREQDQGSRPQEQEQGPRQEEPDRVPPLSPIDYVSILRNAQSLVPFLVLKYRLRESTTKAEMLNMIVSHREHFFEIFSRASEYMQLVFGIEVVEIDPSDHCYFLTPAAGLTYDGMLHDVVGMPKTGLLLIILGIIFMENNCATERAVWDTLSVMGVYPEIEHYIYGQPRKLVIENFVQEQYLEYQRVPNTDPVCYQFVWGPRAHAETTKMRVLKHWVKFSGNDLTAYPNLCEQAMGDERNARA